MYPRSCHIPTNRWNKNSNIGKRNSYLCFNIVLKSKHVNILRSQELFDSSPAVAIEGPCERCGDLCCVCILGSSTVHVRVRHHDSNYLADIIQGLIYTWLPIIRLQTCLAMQTNPCYLPWINEYRSIKASMKNLWHATVVHSIKPLRGTLLRASDKSLRGH